MGEATGMKPMCVRLEAPPAQCTLMRCGANPPKTRFAH